MIRFVTQWQTVAACLISMVATAVLGWAVAAEYAARVGDDGAPLAALHGPVDTGFLADMVVHHDQAITMSQIALSKNFPSTHAMAMSIMLAQQSQIGRMRGWLKMWGAPLLPQTENMEWMLDAGNPEAIQYVAMCNERGGMPGMATNEEMNRLRALEGEAFRVAFLQLMIRHHQGALPMARFASVYAKNRLVRQLARRMVLEQSEEITRMVHMLEQTGAEPLATPLGTAPIYADSSSQ